MLLGTADLAGVALVVATSLTLAAIRPLPLVFAALGAGCDALTVARLECLVVLGAGWVLLGTAAALAGVAFVDTSLTVPLFTVVVARGSGAGLPKSIGRTDLDTTRCRVFFAGLSIGEGIGFSG